MNSYKMILEHFLYQSGVIVEFQDAIALAIGVNQQSVPDFSGEV